MSSTFRGVKQISTKKGKCRLPVQYRPPHPGSQVPASSTGFSKAKQARILTQEEGSSADFDARGGITCERGARAGGLEASAERSPLAPAFLNN